MSLWIELFSTCQQASQDRDQDLVERILGYAWWCWHSRNDAVVTAVACGFYENLPTIPSIRCKFGRHFGPAAFEELKPVFGYFLSVDELAQLEREVANWHRDLAERFGPREIKRRSKSGPSASKQR